MNGQSVTIDVEVILGDGLEMHSAQIEKKETQIVSIEEPITIYFWASNIF